jgi:heme/copper-type cytochrome/quinol oxidase subunit 3
VLAGMLLLSGTRQRRVLCRIEKMLLRDDPSFGSLFAVFTRLTLHEAMPSIEQARPVRWQLRTLVIAAGLAAVLAVLAFSLLASSSHTCGAAPMAGQHQSVSQSDSCSPGLPRMPEGR